MLVTATLALMLGGCVVGPGAAAPPRSAVAPEATRAAGAAILVRPPRHLLAALQTARAGLTDPTGPLRYRIVVCGEAVFALQAGSALQPSIAEAGGEGVEVIACGMSLTEHDVDAASLFGAVQVVPNGLSEVLSLQSRGWISVEL